MKKELIGIVAVVSIIVVFTTIIYNTVEQERKEEKRIKETLDGIKFDPETKRVIINKVKIPKTKVNRVVI